jgi:hypothetical protein
MMYWGIARGSDIRALHEEDEVRQVVRMALHYEVRIRRMSATAKPAAATFRSDLP